MAFSFWVLLLAELCSELADRLGGGSTLTSREYGIVIITAVRRRTSAQTASTPTGSYCYYLNTLLSTLLLSTDHTFFKSEETDAEMRLLLTYIHVPTLSVRMIDTCMMRIGV